LLAVLLAVRSKPLDCSCWVNPFNQVAASYKGNGKWQVFTGWQKKGIRQRDQRGHGELSYADGDNLASQKTLGQEVRQKHG